MSKIRIYISSTYEDLKDCREAVYRELREFSSDLEIVCMEEYTAQEDRPLAKCLADVRSCQVYIGIFAMRYGFVPKEENPDGKSITELEYRQACRQDGTAILAFLSSENEYNLGPKDIERNPDSYGKLIALRQELGNCHCVLYFTNKDNLAKQVKKAIGQAIERVNGKRHETNTDPSSMRSTSSFEPIISIERLPETSGRLIGREAVLAHLLDAWENPRINLLCLIGPGGMGKSALLNHWVAELASQRFNGADAVFAWSFYSQELDQREVSADLFINEAFRFLKIPQDQVPLDPRDKGRKLAELISRQRVILILDALEAVQFTDGRLKDQALSLLLKTLMAENRGLCFITSRVSSPELQPFVGKTVEQIDLEPLTEQAGIRLLRALDVTGEDDELSAAVREYNGHPLLLELLGGFLLDVHLGDITRRHELDVSEEPALRLMKAHERLLGQGAELDLLRIMGLFNRPAPPDAIDAVIAPPSIPGLTDNAAGLTRSEKNRAIIKLRKLHLLTGETSDRDVLEAHAVVRDHFARLLRHEHPAAWKEANSRLFDYYRRLPQSELPSTLEEMAPLFQAVAHGCRAERYQESWDEVEWKRIRREDEGFCVLVLGAWSADLVALGHFFENGFVRPCQTLDGAAKAWLLTETAFNLRGLGRLEEAIPPLRLGLQYHKELEDWWAACDAAGNLSEQLILSAMLSEAKAASEESIVLALRAADLGSIDAARDSTSRCGEPAMLRTFKTLATNLATRAEVFHHMGLCDDSMNAYREAENIYARVVSGAKYLHGARGFHFCELLSDLGQYDEVLERTRFIEEVDRRENRHYSVGLALVARSRALFLKTIPQINEAKDAIRQGLDILRRAGQQELLIRGLITAAQLSCLTGDFALAEGLIEDVMERTRAGKIRLLEIDAHLISAQIGLARKNPRPIESHCNAAELLIKKFGYMRRTADLDRLRGSTA